MHPIIQNIVCMTIVVTIWWSVWSVNDLIAEHLHKKYGYSYLYMYLIAFVITILFLCNLQIVMSISKNNTFI